MNLKGLMGLGLCAVALTAIGCSESGGDETGVGGTTGNAGADSGAEGGSPSAGGSTSTPQTPTVGSFAVVLNPAIDATGPYTSIFGTVYSHPYPSDVIETEVLAGTDCTVYAFSRHTCTNPTCTTSQACVDTNVCADIPALVSVGDVTLSGIGDSEFRLSAINNNYQFAGEIAFPGFSETDTITLSASGDFYPAFEISATGIAPLELAATSYMLIDGSPLELSWTRGASSDTRISIVLNISKHGGSAGYLACEVADTGSLTIPAEQISALIGLGVAGFPQLTVKRFHRGQETVSTGEILLDIAALSSPELSVEGYCSCFDSSDCGSCSDSTKTTCDTVRKLCYAP